MNCACRFRSSSWSGCGAWTTPRRRARRASPLRARWCERVAGMVQGVQLSAPFGRYQMAIDVAEAIGPTLRSNKLPNCENGNRPGRDKCGRSPAGSAGTRRRAVRRGKVVAIPTDALYTLVADPFNLRAVTGVFQAKGREPHRSLPILIRDTMMAEDLAARTEQPLLPAGAALLAGAADDHRAGIGQGAAEGDRQHRPAGAAAIAQRRWPTG